MYDSLVKTGDAAIEHFQRKLSLYTDGKTMVLADNSPVVDMMNKYNLRLDYQGSGKVLLSSKNYWEDSLPTKDDVYERLTSLLMTSSDHDQNTITKDVRMLVDTLRLNDEDFGYLIQSDHPAYVYITGRDYYSEYKVKNTSHVIPSVKEVSLFTSNISIYILEGMEMYGSLSTNLLSKWVQDYNNTCLKDNIIIKSSSSFVRTKGRESTTPKELGNPPFVMHFYLEGKSRSELVDLLSKIIDLVKTLPGLYFKHE